VVNDRHGHEAGDAALRVVAATLAGAGRASDFVSRWGGAEFAILAQGADEADLRTVADSMRVLVARSQVRHGKRTIAVRISLGGTQATAADSPATLLGRADRALYAAKAAGRNRVEIAGSSGART
jgi:diguanylate cyclase (GGDEF)-like protein